MAKTRKFLVKGGRTVVVTAQDNGNVEIGIQGDPRTFPSLDDFLHLFLSEMQELFPQLELSTRDESALWNQSIARALDSLKSAYPITLLRGALGERDPHVLGPEPMKVVRHVTGCPFQDWSFSSNTLAQVQASVAAISQTREQMTAKLSSADTFSAKALKEKGAPRRTAIRKIDSAGADLEQLERDMAAHERGLAAFLKAQLNDASARTWELCTKQPADADSKTCKVKIKKGKFRQILFFSRHRHSVPYFLGPHWTDDDLVFDANPESKLLNTLTTLTSAELEAAFLVFVRDVYLPRLNRQRSATLDVCQFKTAYDPPQAGTPQFIADKYYGDQGMHCTPVATAGCAFTLPQAEHRVLYILLRYKRDFAKAIVAGDAQLMADGLRSASATSQLALLALAYPKLCEALLAIHGRIAASPVQQHKNLVAAIKEFDGRLKLNLKF